MEMILGVGGTVLLLTTLLVKAFNDESGELRGRLFNPFLLLACLVGLWLVDFLVAFAELRARGAVGIGGHYIHDVEELAAGFASYGAINMGFAVGILTAGIMKLPNNAVPRGEEDRALARRISAVLSGACMVVAGAAALYAISVSDAGASGSFSAGRQLFFRDNQLVGLAIKMISPGVVLFLMYRAPFSPSVIATIIGSLIIAYIASGRTAIFTILVGWGFVFGAHYFGPRAYWIVVVVPIAVAGHIGLQYAQRDSALYDSFAEAVEARDGIVGYIFGGEQVAVARPLSIIVNDPSLSIPPFTGLVGAITYIVPRSLADWKPYGPSTIFTQAKFPERWDLYGSEVVISGYGNLVMEFGTMSFAVAGVMAFGWSMALRRPLSRAATPERRVSVALLFLIALIFLRNDAYILGGAIWPYALYAVGYFTMIRLLRPRQELGVRHGNA